MTDLRDRIDSIVTTKIATAILPAVFTTGHEKLAKEATDEIMSILRAADELEKLTPPRKEWSPGEPFLPEACAFLADEYERAGHISEEVECIRRGMPIDHGSHRALTALSKAISAAPPPRAEVLDGWVLVPREPTREMWAASGDAVNKFGHRLKRHHDMYSTAVWSAMLNAAPPAPEVDVESVSEKVRDVLFALVGPESREEWAAIYTAARDILALIQRGGQTDGR